MREIFFEGVNFPLYLVKQVCVDEDKTPVIPACFTPASYTGFHKIPCKNITE
jgi:hypothetical protein